MHNQRYIRGLWLIALALFGCTSEPTERRPDETVMHFPDSMALFNKTLAIASTSADREYSFGRLVTINTDSIKQAINDKEKKKPINWSKVVASNVLIPLEIGELSLTKNYLTFASRDNGQLIALPMSDGLAKCNGKDMEAASCPGAKSLMLPSEDPYAITKLPSAENEELVVVSYLSSDRIDVVKIGSGATLPMNIVKSFHSKDDWINKKFPSAKLKNQRIITRKTQVSFKDDAARSHVYFLLEQHPKKTNAPVKAKAAYLATVKIRDLLGEDLPASKVEVLNLKELFAISGVQDFYVDEESFILYVLARIPEALFKIDLKNLSLMATRVVCSGATSMAVSKEKDLAVVPCFADNRLASFSLSTLDLIRVTEVLGRGPSHAIIDGANNYIYCSFTDGGFVAILDDKLNYLGHLFNKAPENRKGS